MKDRIPKYPGRVTLTPVEGQANTFDMVRADEPEQEGTPLNKTTLLTDETASLFGLGEDATVDGVLSLIPGMVNTAAKIATGSYVGTGKYGSANPVTLTFDFEPKFLFVTSTSGVGFDANLDIESEYVEVYTDVHTLFWWDGLPGVVHGYSITINKNGNSISYYGSSNPYLNYNYNTYHYVAIG